MLAERLIHLIPLIRSSTGASQRSSSGISKQVAALHLLYCPMAQVPTVVQYRALQGGWTKKKLSGNDKLSGLGDTRVNNCPVVIFNYLILFS